MQCECNNCVDIMIGVVCADEECNEEFEIPEGSYIWHPEGTVPRAAATWACPRCGGRRVYD